MLDAIAVLFILSCFAIVLVGYAAGRYERWRGDDPDVDSVGDALMAAQAKRMDIEADIEEGMRSDGDGDHD